MTLRIDYLTFTVKRPVDEVVGVVSVALGQTVEDWTMLGGGGYGYQESMVGPQASRLWWGGKIAGEPRLDVMVSLPGKACALVGHDRMADLLAWAESQGANCTRIDLALDDFGRSVSVQDFEDAYWGVDRVSHARTYSRSVGRRAGRPGEPGVVCKDIVYLGSPTSRRVLRVYDKNLESEGEINAVRWELQERAEAAATLLTQLVRANGEWGEVARARFVDFIDFRDSSSSSEVELRTRVPWYERLMGLVEKAKPYEPKAARKFEDFYSWLLRTQAQGLAVVQTVMGANGLEFLATEGRVKWRPKHRKMVAAVLAGTA